MSKDDITPIQGSSADASIHKAQEARAKERLNQMEAFQVETKEDLQTIREEALFNPRRMNRDFKKLENQTRQPASQTRKAEAKESSEKVENKDAESAAEDYLPEHPELSKRTLTILEQRIRNDDTAEQILRTLQETYTDKSLADEAIDFLILIAGNREERRQKLIEAKERFNAAYGPEIRAGRNIAKEARAFSEVGLGTPTALRDLYRDVTGKPRDPQELFNELTEKFEFSKMKSIIDFILHSLGADMKSKGPSISKAELQRLFSEARSMQAILGLFRFFYVRMKLIKNQFEHYDLTLPSRINFEMLARLFMKLLEERYPSPDKVLKLAFVLGISEEVAAQIVIFTQYRDAMRHVSPRLFKSERHRQDLLMTLMEALSDLEDELEDEEETPKPPKKPKDTIE